MTPPAKGKLIAQKSFDWINEYSGKSPQEVKLTTATQLKRALLDFSFNFEINFMEY